VAKIVIFGAGDIAKLARSYFERDSEHEVVAFTVDTAYRKSESFLGLPLVPFEDLVRLFPPSSHSVFVAVSYAKMNTIRAEKYMQAKAMGYTLPSYVSSRCSYLSDEPPGENCFILEDNTVQPFVKIGDNVTLWSGNHIGHDSIIGDHCFISSHVVISGHVHVHPYCFIGVNATLRNNINVAAHTLIGAGAIIMQDTVEKGVYAPRPTACLGAISDQVEL
jgi:sugar O-acyltransferase (sialic acid O-acetyltransferase NeuD family)